MMENSTDLGIRISMCKFCIKVLEDDCKGDPRQPDALAHYRARLAKLEGKLLNQPTLQEMLPSPPDIVIGLKPAKLFGDVPK